MATTTRGSILAANAYGLRYRDYDTSWYTPVHQVAYDLGCDGVDLSSCRDVTGWRRGELPPGGLSFNHADGLSERGLSLMSVDGDKAHWSEMWMSDRDRVAVHGLLLPYCGSDDEPLVLPYGVDDADEED